MARLGRPLGALFAGAMVAIAAAPAVAQDEASGSDDSVRFLTAEDFVTGWDPYRGLRARGRRSTTRPGSSRSRTASRSTTAPRSMQRT
jgi:hypothetical protein